MMTDYRRNERRPKKVVNKVRAKNEKKSAEKMAKSSTSNGFYYSFLTVILMLCLVQITVSAVLNISKIVSYKAKIIQITKTRDAAQALNEQLQDNIKNFSNITGLDEDEVLVIINTPKEEEKEENDKIKIIGLRKHD